MFVWMYSWWLYKNKRRKWIRGGSTKKKHIAILQTGHYWLSLTNSQRMYVLLKGAQRAPHNTLPTAELLWFINPTSPNYKTNIKWTRQLGKNPTSWSSVNLSNCVIVLRIHWIFWCICIHNAFQCCFIYHCLATIPMSTYDPTFDPPHLGVRMDLEGWKWYQSKSCFWSQLYKSKTVRDRPYVSIRS